MDSLERLTLPTGWSLQHRWPGPAHPSFPPRGDLGLSPGIQEVFINEAQNEPLAYGSPIVMDCCTYGMPAPILHI
ncbi:uncharacterized protein LOC130276509 isoform X2 [Hyla sarda]|uniref:uncharacterized protein LOC130276509 isoform X2 n=1 Tax=Hyla sarda TaxID=327740 RepID=UPI0024C3F841|nr:uncharacterized protein LOC130276509 isoform X2 [Hyla sarda]